MTSDIIYRSFDKIDAHVHLNCKRVDLLKKAESEGFSLISINTEVPQFTRPVQQMNTILEHQKDGASNVQFIASFSTNRWGEDDWQDEAIEQIRKGMDHGAVGVKIWKNIGMVLKDRSGNYVMIDHPSFDPVLDYLEKNAIPLSAHLGEPKNCWLPLKQMTVTSDKEYFSANPEYHMYLHEDCPSYLQQLEARDRMLGKHPRLQFIGLHLASLEWSVDKLAGWLDRHPNCGVDLAERVCHLQYQAVEEWGKVKNFIETYQDRIIYGSDQIDDGTLAGSELQKVVRTKWHSEFKFFAENGSQTAWNVSKPFQGLDLDRKIVLKIFRDNAIRYYPRLKTHLQQLYPTN